LAPFVDKKIEDELYCMDQCELTNDKLSDRQNNYFATASLIEHKANRISESMAFLRKELK
jgi:hypothetical protein